MAKKGLVIAGGVAVVVFGMLSANREQNRDAEEAVAAANLNVWMDRHGVLITGLGALTAETCLPQTIPIPGRSLGEAEWRAVGHRGDESAPDAHDIARTSDGTRVSAIRGRVGTDAVRLAIVSEAGEGGAPSEPVEGRVCGLGNDGFSVDLPPGLGDNLLLVRPAVASSATEPDG